MLAKIGSLGGLLGPRIDHPLADPKALRRVLAELPADNGFKTLDEVAGWLESLDGADDFPAELRLEVVRQLDEAAQPHLRRLSRDYLQSSRMSRAEEKRLWSIIRGFWHLLAAGYEQCLQSAVAKGKVPDSLKPVLPLLCGRLVGALGAVNKWDCFHYAPDASALWAHLGHACRVAEEVGAASRPVQLYPQPAAMTTVAQEYLKVLVFQASSVDCLLPLEVELAERLIAHFIPHFVFGPEGRPDSVYWVDLAQAQPPRRLVHLPKEPTPGLRFFQPGDAHGHLEALVRDLEKGHDLPPELNLGGLYPVRTVLPVLKHLAACLAPIPPQRQHRRHQVDKHRMAVLGGFSQALAAFSRNADDQPGEPGMESWVVEDVSLGGFGAVIQAMPAEWLKIGALLALQPEGGDNWLVGIVRRCHRHADGDLRVGIECMAKQAAAVELKPRSPSGQSAGPDFAALRLEDGGEAGEMRFILPPAVFDPRESLELEQDGQRLLLTPVALVERTTDYGVARYRALTAE